MKVAKACGAFSAVVGLLFGAAPASAEWVAQGTLKRDVKAGTESDPCSASLRVRIEVEEPELYIATERPTTAECKAQTADKKKYKVAGIRFAGGVKTYDAQNESERLVLIDRRGPDGDPAWHVSVKEPLEAGKIKDEFSGGDIEDKNLSAKGIEKHDLVMFLSQMMPARDVRLLVYPLLLDSLQSMPGPPERPKAYQIRISSDLPLAKVLPLLKKIELITEVAPVVDSQNPTEPQP